MVQLAITMCESLTRTMPTSYHIVGELTEEVVTPRDYVLKKIVQVDWHEPLQQI